MKTLLFENRLERRGHCPYITDVGGIGVDLYHHVLFSTAFNPATSLFWDLKIDPYEND